MPHGQMVPNVLLCFLFDWLYRPVLCSVFREVQAEMASCVCLAGVEAMEEIGAGFLRFDSSWKAWTFLLTWFAELDEVT